MGRIADIEKELAKLNRTLTVRKKNLKEEEEGILLNLLKNLIYFFRS